MLEKMWDDTVRLGTWPFCVADVLFVRLQARHHRQQVNARAGARQISMVGTIRGGIVRLGTWLFCVAAVLSVGLQTQHQHPPESQHYQPPRTRPQNLPQTPHHQPPRTQHVHRQVNATTGVSQTTGVETIRDDTARLGIWHLRVEAVLFVVRHHHPRQGEQ